MARLTQRACVNAQSGSTARDIPDGVVSGLTLRVTPAGEKMFSLRYRIGGKQRRLKIGRFPDLSVDQARKIARQAIATAAEGHDPRDVKRNHVEDRERHEFTAVWSDYLRHHVRAKLRPRSASDYEAVGRKFLLAAWSGRDVREITRRDCAGLMDQLAAEGVAQRRLHVFRVASAFFSWAAARGTVEGNPWAHVPLPVRVVKRERVLSDRELLALWRVLDSMHPSVAALFRCLILVPLRKNELARLTWDELHSDRLEIGAGRLKGGRSRIVPLSTAARAILAGLERRGEFVFSTRLTGSTPISGWSKIKLALDQGMAAELGKAPEPWVVHDIRRSAATGMAGLGVRSEVLVKLLGHADGAGVGGPVLAIYARAELLEEQAAALEKWADHIAELVTPDGAVPLAGRA